MKLEFIVDEEELKRLVATYIAQKANVEIDPKQITFAVMTKNNYRAKEWEDGRFRASFYGEV